MKKKNVNRSWAGKYAQESANRRFIDEVDKDSRDLLQEIDTSYQREKDWLKEEPKPSGNNSYRKNWWNSHGRQMNDFQINDALGYIDRAEQWNSLAEQLKESWNIEDRVNKINQEIEDIRNTPVDSREGLVVSEAKIQDLLDEQQRLVQRHADLLQSVEAFKSYIPGGIKARYYDLVAGNGENSIFANNFIFGRTTQAHDEMGDILRHTASMFQPGRSRLEQRQMLNRAIQEKDNKIQEWQKVIEENIKDRESYGQVDDWFKLKEEAAGTNIFDKNTWLYKMPGLIAGSTSGASKILPAMLTGLATSAAIGATGGAAAVAIGAIGGLSTMSLNYGAGVAENNAEVAMAYTERLEDYLKNQEGTNGTLYDDIVKEGRNKLISSNIENLTDKQIFELYRKGAYTSNNTVANKKMRGLAVGIENQFLDDMAATTWSSLLETALEIIPIGRAISVPKAIRYQMLKTAARREFMRKGITDTLAKGYEIGLAVNPIAGVLYAPIHLAVSPAANRIGRSAREILSNISKTASIAERIPEQVLAKKFMRDTNVRYFKDIAGRYALASASEGIEEGKQYISSERYKSGEYNSAKIKSVGETILDDFLAGSKSAGLLLGMPFEGVMSERDRRILQEIKGGFIVGGLLTSIVNVASSIYPYTKERGVNSAIINSVLLDKASKIDAFNKAKIYAEASKSQSAYSNMLNGFDRLRSANKDLYDSSGEYAVSPDHIQEEELAFKNVALMANDAYTVKQAEAQGISRSSDDYNSFVAMKRIVSEELNDQSDVLKEANKNFNDVLQRITYSILDQRLRDSSMEDAAEEDQQTSSPIALHTSVEDYNQMQNVANYAALLRRKELLELGILNAERGRNNRIKSILNKQLTEVNDRISNLKKVILSYTHEDETIDINDVDVVEKRLALDKQNHDDLSEAYRQALVAEQDYDLALQQYEAVVGKAKLNGEEIKDYRNIDWGKEYNNVTFEGGKFRDILRELNETIQDDEDLASTIDLDFDNRTDDEGNEVVTPQEAEAQEQQVPANNPEAEFIEDTKKNRKQYEAPAVYAPSGANNVLAQGESTFDPNKNLTEADFPKPEMFTQDPGSLLRLTYLDGEYKKAIEWYTRQQSNKIYLLLDEYQKLFIRTGESLDSAMGGPTALMYAALSSLNLSMALSFLELYIPEKILETLNSVNKDILWFEKVIAYLKNKPDYEDRKKDTALPVTPPTPPSSPTTLPENSAVEVGPDGALRPTQVEQLPQIPLNPSEPVTQTQPTVAPETSQIQPDGLKNAILLEDLDRADKSIVAKPNKIYYSLKTDKQGYTSIKLGRSVTGKDGQLRLVKVSLGGVYVDTAAKDLLSEEDYDIIYGDHPGVFDELNIRVVKFIIAPDGTFAGTVLIKDADGKGVTSFNVTFKQNPIESISENQDRRVVPPNPPTPPSTLTQFSEPSDEQHKTIEALNRRAEQSKQYVKEVTPNYYLIEVNGQQIKMPRVHSVMPEYWADYNMFPPALQVGNAIDNLARIFFGDKNNIILYETNKQALIDKLANEYASHKDNPNDPSLKKLKKLYYRDLFNRPEQFEKTIDDLYNLFKEYLKLGWELSTEPIVWYSQFATGWVAGETDMLAVDRNGNIHIIDFKTAMGQEDSAVDPFGRYTTRYNNKLPKELEDRLYLLNKSDLTSGPRKKGLSKTARQLVRDIRKAKGTNQIIIVWDDEAELAVMRYIASDYSNLNSSKFRVTHEFDGKIKGSKEDEYSDQLTAYMEMIQKNLFNVVDMEVIGFRASYNYDGEGSAADLLSINSVRNERYGKPFRIKVFDSDEMKYILNNEGDPVEIVSNEPDAVIDSQNKNGINDSTKVLELSKSDQYLPKNPEPEVTTPGTTEPIQITGYSNLNVNVVNQHPDLVRGAVFDKQFVDDLIVNGGVELYTETVKGKPTLYADITYKGKTYKRIYIYGEQTGLLAEVQRLEANKLPGQKIVATKITRTAGQIKSGSVKPVLQSNLIDESVSQLQFNSSSKTFGFVKNGNVTVFVGENVNTQDSIYRFTNSSPANGTLVYLKKLHRSESEGGDTIVPVTIKRKNLAKDGDFIIECLSSIDALNLPYTTVINGKDVSIGATRKELLNMLIPYVEDVNQYISTYGIVRDPNMPSVFYILNNKKQWVSRVDLRNEDSINSFKESLLNLYIEEQHLLLASKLTGNTNAVFKKIYKFFASNKDGIKSLSISDSLKFDFDDFSLGLTGLGWYVKHGIFTTDYAGFDSPKISINGVGYAEEKVKPAEPTKPNSIDDITPQQGFSLDDLDFTNWGGLDKRKTSKDENKPLLTEKEIKKRLRPILGDLVDDPDVVRVINTLSNDPRVTNAQVVGKATADAITLYNAAFEGVDYHEAFHRIFELFVPKNTRDSIYNKVAARLGIDLSQSNKNNDYIGHRQVAEWVADKYMEFRRYNISTGIQWLDHVINYIIDTIRALCSINNRDLYKVFLDVNNGKYRNLKKASKENVDRFNTLFKNLNYEIHSTNFDHIANDEMYEELKNSMFYCLITGQNINVSGSTVQNTQITPDAIKRGADRLKKHGFDIFGTEVDPDKKTAAQLAMTEMLVKFDAVADDLAAMMATISTDYRKIMQDEGREDADGGESQSSYDENFFKWSYEFDKFDKTSSRVKFFFATIPDLLFSDDTHKSYKHATNSLGLPQFVPMNYVYNEVLSSLWDVDTLEEVVSRLSDLALQDPMYAIILSNLRKVINGRLSADNEALLAQLMTTIRSNRHTFMLLRSVSDPQGMYDIILQRSDADYNARVFPQQWSQVLAKGGSETLKINKNGLIIFNPKNKYAVYTFSKIAKLFNEIQQVVSEVNGGKGEITIPEYDYNRYEIGLSVGDKTSAYDIRPEDTVADITDQKGCNKVKSAIVNALNHIGINIHIEELDFMLRHKYGTTDWQALKQMVQSTDETDSISSFIFFLNNIVKNNKLNINNEGQFTNSTGRNVNFDNVFSDMAFIKELGNWKYEYRHAHDQLSVLATGGNRFYEMSDNDYMSDVLRSLNKRNKWFDSLREDPYNYFVGDADNFGNRNVYGSLTLKQLSENPNLKIALKHFIGFKTDKKGDEGLDYFEISRREDYLSKVGILENDGMVSLTLSDKKKYVYITGIKLPGMDYERIRKSNDSAVDLDLAKQIILVPDSTASSVYNIQQREDVVDQMISYATTEYESILRNSVRLKDGHRQVANFDTKEQSVRFSSLLGVWEQTFDKDGKPAGEQYISFNDGKKSWEENLAIAEAYFFDKSIDEQRALIGRILTKRAEKELETAAKLGLIEKVGNNINPFYNYKNIGLNAKVIKSIKASYLASGRLLLYSEAESLAVVMYLNDISAKAIMSGQEMERLFSGNPAFYKWTYDKNGKLVDRTVDELKRLGGLGSTGINNFTELTSIPSKYLENGVFTGKYRCAEVDNEMTSSPQFEYITKSMYEGKLREFLIDELTILSIEYANREHESNLVSIRKNKDLTESEKARLIDEENSSYELRLQEIKEEVCSNIDNMSLEQLEKDYPKAAAEAKLKAKEVSDALANDIDVADGGAYISDTMCEMLLRMEGAYSKDIQEAFKILRGEVKADYLGQIEAYQKVLTSVIGNYKYTAFGRRMQNGVSVPYYHKMALFPIFECIATGKLSNIFDKMKEQGIDMLLVNSAVKVGSEGSKSIDWNKYRQDDDPTNEANFSEQGIDGMSWKPTFQESFNFNTYDCEFDYLRKQLNTDPKEEELLRMGTLMQKVVFSNLQIGRTYTTQSGESITGKKLLDRIMNSSNLLSNIGVDKINQRFFVTNNKGELLDINGDVITDSVDNTGTIIPARNSNKRVLDIEKFSKEVSKMMSDRGADKNIMKALELVTTTAGKQLLIPLGAISNANWLESVLISALNKEIVDVNTPGAFYIQRSVWAMQGARMYDRQKGNIKGRQLYNGKRLQMVNEEGSMDCVISIDFYEHILPMVQSDEYELDEDDNYIYQKDKDGNYKTDKYGNYIPKRKMRKMTFDEARQWLIDQGIIGGKSNIVAYRIPTQAESSIHALRVVDVLPVVRDTIILPEEFTKLTGSDFDIDKLGLSTINWDVKGKKASDQFAEGTEKYYLNQLIRDYITLLIDTHSQHILHRSIDNDTKLLKNVLKEIESSKSIEEEPYGFYSLSTQTERKNDYITGKIGIGPFALNNNNHILTMLYGVKFKLFDNSIMTVLGLNDLSKSKDYEDNSVLSWISALINAHVDIAKDPYIGRLNVNQFTYNLVNTLIRTGFGKKTFYFTTQPIMKELADAYIKAGSSYMADQYKSLYLLQKEAIEKVAKDKFSEIKINNWTFDEVVEGLQNPLDNKYKPVINKLINELFSSSEFRYNAGKDFNKTLGFDNLDNYQTQMLIYFAYLQFNPYALSVSNLVKYSKIDTKKHGKSYIEQQVYQKGFRDLFYNPDGTGLFEEAGILRMASESYIALKTNNAISMTKNILKGQFLQSTNAFDNAVNQVLAMIGKSDSKNVDLYKKISQAIMASIKSEFINQYSSDLRPDDKQYIRDLVSESEENLEYTQSAQSNRLKVVGTPKHDLSTYIGSKIYVSFEHEGTHWNFAYTVLGYDSETNELIVDTTRKVDNTGKMRIVGGKNTIYDRFLRLAVELRDDPEYQDVLDASGEPSNALLRNLVTGNTFEYKSPIQSSISYLAPEKEDTYPTLKFIKLFNALDQNGVESNRIIDAWDELLHDNKHPLLKKFAEDLVVYAFVTSGDQGGFTKFFKQVPLSWRLESGYADFIQRKLVEYQSQDIPADQLQDAILNNWFESLLVPKYEMYDKDSNIPNFIAYSGERQNTGYRAEMPYPAILVALKDNNGVLEPSIDPETAPLFIKIPRRKEKDARDSQRRVTVYKRVSYGMRQSITGEWVHYPVYVKVEPKGNLLKGNYLMTEYGREDAINKEYTPSEEGLKAMYKLGDFIANSTILLYKTKWGDKYAQMIEDMNYRYLFINVYKGDEHKFNKAFVENKSPLKALIGKSAVVNTTDNEGFHEDELDCTITAAKPIKEGYLITIDLKGKEYNIKLDLDFQVINLNSRFSDIVIYPDDNSADMSLKEYLDTNPTTTQSQNVNSKSIETEAQEVDIPKPANNSLDFNEYKTESFGVEVSNGSEDFWNKINNGWQETHPTGIVAYRKYGTNPKTFTPQTVEEGWIGNPFDWQKYGTGNASQMFYDWLTTGNNHGEPLANELFRQAVLLKIMSSGDQITTPILYYKELGYMSHATVIGYLINNKSLIYKQLSQLKPTEESNSTFTYARTHENGYEVSSKGDSRFSAMFAKFKEGTKLLGHDVGGRTIESVYQHAIKQDDWDTDNNSKTGAPKSKRIITGNTEDDSYNQGYLPLWKEWARQNPQLIEELRKNASGKVLTDQFASTKVSQARALADILNQTANSANRPLPEFNGISEQDVRKAISLAENTLEHAQGVVYQILHNAKYRKISEQDLKDLYKYQLIADEHTKLLNGLYDGSSEVIINEHGVPQVVNKQTRRQNEVNSINQNVYDEYLNNPNNRRFNKLAKVVFDTIDKFGIQIEYDPELEVLGKFVRGYNKILVNPNHDSTNTVLHECIHAITSYYLDAYEDDKKSLPKEIQTAVEELKYCYDLLKNDAFETGDLTKDSPFLMYELGESDKYGLTNIREFVAELSNPDFINRIKDYDKRHDSSIFDKLIDIIAKILGIKKEYKDVLTTSYQALKVLLEIPDKSLFDKKESEIHTMKENLKKINTDTTIIVRQNNKYKPIIDAIEKTEDERSEMTVTMDIGDIDFLWHVPNVKDKMALKGDIIKVVFNDNTGYIVLTKPFTKMEDKFTEDKKPFEISFKVITAEFLQSTSFKINSNNNSFTQLSDDTFDLLQKVYKNRKNNTELNRLRVESYVKAKTQGIYKFKDKLFAAWRAVGEINDRLGTTFEVEINKTTLGVSIPSKSSSVRKNVNPYREYVDDSDVIFSLIYNEPSEDSAKLILELNGYNTNDESILIALGKLIKKLCGGK